LSLAVHLILDEPLWGEEMALKAVCERALSAITPLQAPPEDVNAVSILLADDAVLQALNRQFRGIDKPTDVLSFEADAALRPLLGDIALAYGVASRDAAFASRALENHLMHLIIHAYLHLTGHDHEAADDADRMEALEIKALASLGLPNPYQALA
jgi:probable rRNA maturation factor